MPIDRSGPTPAFFKYVTSNALIPFSGHPNSDLLAIATVAGFVWVEIPRFQRGISWKVDDIQEFLESNSVLLGNVILAQFSRGNQFQYLPSEASTYTVLVDGLQRFTVGTMLLAILHPLVLSPTPSHPGDATYFTPLRLHVASFHPVYMHNDLELRNHPRVAISSQYTALREQLESYVKTELNEGRGQQLAKQVNETFLNRQVAIDVYYNFPGPVQLMNTFLGINTVRVDLGPVDLLRAQIIERAASSNWTATDIEDVENDFTDTFTIDEKPDGELLPFASAVLKCISDKPTRIFPTWETGLSRQEVDNFLDFVSDFKELNGLNYLSEIRECGSIPFAIVLAYYYARVIHGGQALPSFLSGGTAEDPDLHRFLIASYRSLFSGSIGRTRVLAEYVLEGKLTVSLAEIADSLSRQALGIAVNESPASQWLVSFLSRTDKTKAKRVFNALLLPPKAGGFGVQAFAPLKFGRGAKSFHIDHLIPEKLLDNQQGGFEEGHTLRNLAPLPANQNQVAKATNCSSKLASTGIYGTYLASGSAVHPAHPYCQWLVSVHAPSVLPAELDQQVLLERNASPDIGDRRIQYVSGQLLDRI